MSYQYNQPFCLNYEYFQWLNIINSNIFGIVMNGFDNKDTDLNYDGVFIMIVVNT